MQQMLFAYDEYKKQDVSYQNQHSQDVGYGNVGGRYNQQQFGPPIKSFSCHRSFVMINTLMFYVIRAAANTAFKACMTSHGLLILIKNYHSADR